MLRLRPYKPCDAAAIVSWIGDERAFRKWSADRLGAYPITAEDLNRHYAQQADSDSFYEFTAFDEAGPAGHLIMCFLDEEKQDLRFGFVIVDGTRRGAGLGREMLTLALRYAFEILKVRRVSLSVFENNEPALRCYRAIGFRESKKEPSSFAAMGETWRRIEMEIQNPARVNAQPVPNAFQTKNPSKGGRPMFFLQTERLTITEFTLQMAKDVCENSLDEDTRRFVPDEVFETEEDAAETIEFLMAQYDGDEGPFVYPVLRKDGTNLGYVQAVPLDAAHWEIGYHIAKRFTGNGYATEAVSAFLPVIMKQIGIREIDGVCLAENVASRRVLEKCGFELFFEGMGNYQGAERQICRTRFTLA